MTALCSIVRLSEEDRFHFGRSKVWIRCEVSRYTSEVVLALPRTHFLHHISETLHQSSLIQTSLLLKLHWCSFDVLWLWSKLSSNFLLQCLYHKLLTAHAEHSRLGNNICVVPWCCSPVPNKMAGSLDIKYPWPVTQQWPEEVMSGKNVPGPVRQTDTSGRASLFLPGISYHVSLMSVQVAETNSKHLPPF